MVRSKRKQKCQAHKKSPQRTREYAEKEEFDTLTGDIIGAAIEVHHALGP